MGFLEDCQDYYGSEDFYAILGLPRTAIDSEIKKAYRKLSLFVHPDRNQEDVEKATRKFQILSKIHTVLSDKDKRAIYDETGQIDDEDCEENKDWLSYWRILFPSVTTKDIDDFMENYVGSEEEKEDLKKYYLQFEGNMDIISEHLFSYNFENEDRLVSILSKMIKQKEIPSFPAFKDETSAKKLKRRKKFEREAKQAKKIQDRLEEENSLASAIAKRMQSRHTTFNNMIEEMEKKYQKKPKSKKK